VTYKYGGGCLEIESKLEELAKSRNLPIEKLQKEFRELSKQFKEQQIKEPEKVAWHKLLIKYRETRRKAEVAHFIGFKIGDGGIRDAADFYRRKVQRLIDEQGLDAAEQQGFIKEFEGEYVIIDQREKDRFGNPNPNKGKPLDPERKELSRNLWLLVTKEGETEMKLARLETTSNKLAELWDDLPFHKLCRFPALIHESTEREYVLRGSTAKSTPTIFKKHEKADEFNYVDAFKEFFKEDFIDYDKLEDQYELTKDTWDRYTVLHGVLGWAEEEERVIRRGILVDPEKGFLSSHQVPLGIPKHIEIDFEEGTEVYVFGKLDPIRRRDPDTGEWIEQGIRLTVYGFLPLTKAPKMKEELTGWIE